MAFSVQSPAGHTRKEFFKQNNAVCSCLRPDDDGDDGADDDGCVCDASIVYALVLCTWYGDQYTLARDIYNPGQRES